VIDITEALAIVRAKESKQKVSPALFLFCDRWVTSVQQFCTSFAMHLRFVFEVLSPRALELRTLPFCLWELFSDECIELVRLGDRYLRVSLWRDAEKAYSEATALFLLLIAGDRNDLPQLARLAPMRLCHALFAQRKYREAAQAMLVGLVYFPSFPQLELGEPRSALHAREWGEHVNSRISFSCVTLAFLSPLSDPQILYHQPEEYCVLLADLEKDAAAEQVKEELPPTPFPKSPLTLVRLPIHIHRTPRQTCACC